MYEIVFDLYSWDFMKNHSEWLKLQAHFTVKTFCPLENLKFWQFFHKFTGFFSLNQNEPLSSLDPLVNIAFKISFWIWFRKKGSSIFQLNPSLLEERTLCMYEKSFQRHFTNLFESQPLLCDNETHKEYLNVSLTFTKIPSDHYKPASKAKKK